MRSFSKIAVAFGVVFQLVFAQAGQITGKVVDEQLKALVGANVYLSGTILGSSTDKSGRFLIDNVPPGNYILIISIIGYETHQQAITLQANEKSDIGTITLRESAISQSPIVVTAGKYEQQVQDVPASITSVSSEELQNRNIITIDQALSYVSGVNLNGNQMSIRGSTGYSQGVGSRILMLIDGIPLLTADTRDIVFSVVPTYLVERIEVLKGAGSALYGSSALGGVVNIITKPIGDQPSWHIRSYGGAYAKPNYDQWKWTDQRLFSNGINITHARTLNNVQALLGFSRDEDDGYRKNTYLQRWTGSGKLEWRISPYWLWTISGNYMKQKRGNFLFWQDQQNALIPASGQEQGRVNSERYYFTSQLQHIYSPTQVLYIKTVWFYNQTADIVTPNTPEAVSTAENFNGEIQYNGQFGKLIFIAGATSDFGNVKSDRFGNRKSRGGAIYQQIEWPIHPKWRVTAGWRLDVIDIDSLTFKKWHWNPKLGIVFQPTEVTAARIAIGSGFRAPSLAEAFTSTYASGIQVVPNRDIKPEKSIYTEIGLNSFLAPSIFGDIAFFYNRFEELIEPTFLPRGVAQFVNIIDARTIGVETTLSGHHFSGSLLWHAGYSYIESKNLVTDDFLDFRPRHLFTMSINGKHGFWTAGGDYRYISKYDRINKLLRLFVPNADTRVDAHVVDLRAGITFALMQSRAALQFQLKNALNYNYLEFVGSLAPPRRYELTLDLTF
jgi:iron complex outermembrane receptor protein